MPVKNNNRPDRGANRKAGNAPKETPTQARARLAKELRIKPNTIAMIDLMENSTKPLSQTEAYIRTHQTDNRRVAAVEASRLLAKPNVQIYKASAVSKAKKRIVKLVDSQNETIALKASQDIIDRVEGKAGHNEADKSRTVTVKLDLTGVKLGNHYLPSAVLNDVV